jgi:enoyl-CoA hydratase/carnithine racemase
MSGPDAEELVGVSRDEGVVTLTLNRPRQRNALSAPLIAAFVAACDAVARDPTVGCVVIAGAGEDFCAGGDIAEMAASVAKASGADLRDGFRAGVQSIPRALQRLEMPVIAAVHGRAIGAGCDLALFCDLRVASEEASFAESFIRLGLVSGDGGAWALPRVVGLPRALEMTLTGEALGAARALEIGLVNHVTSRAELLGFAQGLAAKMARHPAQALRMTKTLVRQSATAALDPALEMAAAMQALCQLTDFHRDAIARFTRPAKDTPSSAQAVT